jgi:hypothetical protein
MQASHATMQASHATMHAQLDSILLHIRGLENLAYPIYFITHKYQIIVGKIIDFYMNSILHRHGESFSGSQLNESNI